MSLTIDAIEAARPRHKAYKLSDAGGMYLEVSPNGGKWWRLKYRFARKEKRISLGVYPAVSLDQARERRTFYRDVLANRIDPGQLIKAERVKRNAEEFRAYMLGPFTLDDNGALSLYVLAACRT